METRRASLPRRVWLTLVGVVLTVLAMLGGGALDAIRDKLSSHRPPVQTPWVFHSGEHELPRQEPLAADGSIAYNLTAGTITATASGQIGVGPDGRPVYRGGSILWA